MEKTLLIIKPDAVERSLIGEIIRRIESARLKIVNLRYMKMTKSVAEDFYEVHRGKPFYDELTNFMSSGAIVPMVVMGDNAISGIRELIGKTNPAEAHPGTIRYDLAVSHTKNSVHASDSPANAEREIHFFFPKEQV
ncbi:MAG: nucleoside-diphosphate kinase [candidate division Zixibacteria bacterium]|nr:nucleoside-diphosphate kinase [candidate division Zixibacteria bacterium]